MSTSFWSFLVQEDSVPLRSLQWSSFCPICIWTSQRSALSVSHLNAVFNIKQKIRTQSIAIWKCLRTENAPGALGGALPKAATNSVARELAAWRSSVVGQACDGINIETPYELLKRAASDVCVCVCVNTRILPYVARASCAFADTSPNLCAEIALAHGRQ